MLACLTGYTLVGISGYAAYPKNVASNVLNSFGDDDALLQVARLLMGLNGIVSYPVNLFPCRQVRLIDCPPVHSHPPLPVRVDTVERRCGCVATMTRVRRQQPCQSALYNHSRAVIAGYFMASGCGTQHCACMACRRWTTCWCRHLAGCQTRGPAAPGTSRSQGCCLRAPWAWRS